MSYSNLYVYVSIGGSSVHYFLCSNLVSAVFTEKQRNRKMYKEEYQNLLTRQEILQDEAASISRNISKLTSKMTKEKQQIDSISKEKENIQSRIQTLQQQCQALAEHRRDYERNYEEFDNQSESEKKRLVLVKNSLKSVQEQIEKVRKQNSKIFLVLVKKSLRSVLEQFKKMLKIVSLTQKVMISMRFNLCLVQSILFTTTVFVAQ